LGFALGVIFVNLFWMKLIIVESPTKARTLAGFLGKAYRLEATLGHIRDLPKNELGVDVEHDFTPSYVPVPGREKRVKELKKLAKEAEEVILATDLDREGEAIAWHLLEAVGEGKKAKTPLRIVFHEITKEAVKKALAHPRPIDTDLVNAQQARRVLDRLVGYQLSPLLWKKVRYGLSAGRVQSPAVRLIVEREREREAFVPEEIWDLNAVLAAQARPEDVFEAKLVKIDGRAAKLATGKEAAAASARLKSKNWRVIAVEKKTRKRSPYPPFTTSSLQRAAAGAYGFSAKKTMSLAQNLYEKGLITYHRTDSTNLAASALTEIRALIKKDYGAAYLPAKKRIYKTKVKVAQEAHEAIRPTKAARKEVNLRGRFAKDAARLYGLIWRQTVACQMKKAVYDQVRVEIEPQPAGEEHYLFRATGSSLVFDGWLKVTGRPSEDEDASLPELHQDEALVLKELKSKQRFTQPPPRYTEASLIKALEEKGIGRPSTYAPILSTIQARGYVRREGKNLLPTATGEVVTDLLLDHFGKVVDYDFTAQLEEEFDEIARGERDWIRVVREFYLPFEKTLQEKMKTIKKEEVVVRRRLEEKCPECGHDLVVKLGKFGEFVSCANFPDCSYSRPVARKQEAGEAGSAGDREGRSGGGNGEAAGGRAEVDEEQFKDACPECGGKLVLKEGRYGKFIACSNYPRCKYTRNYLDKIGLKCPGCGEGEVVQKRSRKGKAFYGCSRYPECDWASWERPAREEG
jgi:DNA topoisomerase-1